MSLQGPRRSSRSAGGDEWHEIDMPRVTVITATYDWAPVLPYSIGSILDQKFTDFELLVMGDGCTDESGEVVDALGDGRVHWHNLPEHTGHQSAANNEGIRRAKGDIIAYLGHDDLWLPHHLTVLLEALDDGARIAHGTVVIVPASGRPYRSPTARWVYRSGEWIAPTSLVHNREAAELVGGWRPPSDTGILDPEADLLRRMTAVVGPPRWVRRLTCVKFPAAGRPDVYRDRPSHEQAYWLRRIRENDDLEATLFAATRRPTFKQILGGVRRRLRVATRFWWPASMFPASTAEDRQRIARRFKGLDN